MADLSKNLLDWNDPALQLGLLDWNEPYFDSQSESAGFATYARAVAAVRQAMVLPDPPAAAARPVGPADPTESSLDIKVFIALTELAQKAVLQFDGDASQASTQAQVTLGGIGTHVTRPDDGSLPASAAQTLEKMGLQAGRIEEIVAQNVEPDRFMLHVLGMPAQRFPCTHALLRASILGANIFCLRLKEQFRVSRPTQVDDPKTHTPVIKLPPLLPLPGHSSFPGGHAMQCATAAGVLQALLKPAATSAAPHTEAADPLLGLAYRIAENREIAGLHHSIDTAAGLGLGLWFAQALLALEGATGMHMLDRLLRAARRECAPPEADDDNALRRKA